MILNSVEKVEQFQARKELLQEYFRKIPDIHVEILGSDKTFIDSLNDNKDIYLNLVADINEVLAKPDLNSSLNASCSVNNSQVVSDSSTKLPPTDIPSFDGKNLTHFKSFMDIFSAIVDKNSHLKDIEKLFYLRKP